MNGKHVRITVQDVERGEIGGAAGDKRRSESEHWCYRFVPGWSVVRDLRVWQHCMVQIQHNGTIDGDISTEDASLPSVWVETLGCTAGQVLEQ